jgi:hypothetical protein
MRASQRDHLFSFSEYAKGHDCYYLNAFTSTIPFYFSYIKFDLVVFSWSFLGNRFTQKSFSKSLNKIASVKSYNCVKVALPQDEFSNTEAICDVINNFKINIVYSVSPKTEWHKMYKTVDFNEVKFYQVLTGYLDEKLVRRISSDLLNNDRTIDVGYRSGSAVYWGRFNLIKFKIAEVFQEKLKETSLKTDIAFGWNNFLMGDAWYDFLLKCKYMPGVEGGSSILDWDGSLFDEVKKYLLVNPSADFDEIEKNCIPKGKDGELSVIALSPRHLEACLTKTCQILIEGSYNGILVPGKHYIALKSDFSNLDTVVTHILNDDVRNDIIETAYRDIVLSDKYSYRSFVNFVLETSEIFNKSYFKSSPFLFFLHKKYDKLSWFYVFVFSFFRGVRDYFKLKYNAKLKK